MFPAYSNSESWREPTYPTEGSSERDAASCSYNSFKSVRTLRDEKEKKRKKLELEKIEKKRKERERSKEEEKKRRALSKYSIKMVSLDSDDESDGLDISAEGVRKLEERYKRKKFKMRITSSESSESDDGDAALPSVCQILAQNIEWSFLKSDWNPNIPSSFLVNDYKAVRGNVFYDSLPKKEVSDYNLSLYRLMGSNDELSRLIFPNKRNIKKQKRYFTEKVFKAWNDNPVIRDVRIINEPISGYVDLNLNKQKQLVEMDWESFQPRTDKISETEATPEILSKLYNKRLKDDEKNIDLWMRFIAVQDEIYMERSSANNEKKSKRNCLTDRALLDRKLEILNKAIQKNPLSVKLKIERLKIGRHFWEAEKFEHEVKTVEFYHVNDPEMWTGIFDLMENDIRRFSFERMLRLLNHGIDQLSVVLRGDIVTHPALPGTETYLVSIMIRMIRLMLNCGYSERAVGCAQAFFEFNICYPPKYKNFSLREKKDAFRLFWESGIARIGDEGGKGWDKSLDAINSNNISTDRSEVEEEDSRREKLEFDYANGTGNDGKKRTLSEIWRYVEGVRSSGLWRPIRDRQIEVDDRDRYVSFQHVQAMLTFVDKEASVKFLFDVLNLFGASIYGREDVSPEKISHSFGSFPSHLFMQFQGFNSFITRLFETAVSYLPEYASQLLSSLLVTNWDYILNNSVLPQERLLKTLRSEAKSVIAKDPNNKSLWATFAEKLVAFGDSEYPRKIALSWLSGKVIWKMGISDRIPLFRLVICYVLSSEKSRWSFILGKMFITGEINEDLDTNPKGPMVEKQYNRFLAEAIERSFSSWEASEVDLISSLILLYNARTNEGTTHIRRINIVHESVRNNILKQKLPIFMKLYVELTQEHLSLHKNLTPKILHDELERLVDEFPRNIYFLKTLIDNSCLGKGVYRLSKLLQSGSNDFIVELNRAFGLVYLELSRYRLQTICFEAQCHSVEKLCGTLELVSDRLSHRYDIFWRLLLFIRKERNEVERFREVFYLSQGVCPWSKSLILDYAKMDPEAYVTLLTLMEEKCLRVHCQKEEVPLLGIN